MSSILFLTSCSLHVILPLSSDKSFNCESGLSKHDQQVHVQYLHYIAKLQWSGLPAGRSSILKPEYMYTCNGIWCM